MAKIKKQHAITYEHIGITLVILFIGFVVLSAIAFWTPVNIKENAFYLCSSKDGRINDVIVISRNYPTYLPVDGNHDVAYNCRRQIPVKFKK